jgi:hypothetical protein
MAAALDAHRTSTAIISIGQRPIIVVMYVPFSYKTSHPLGPGLLIASSWIFFAFTTINIACQVIAAL